MDSLLKKSASTELEDLIKYVNKCQLDELTLYSKISNTFGQLGALFGGFNNNAVSRKDEIKNACIAFNNAFKHQREMKEDYKDLKLITYGTTLDCILPALLGDVVYLRNSNYLKKLKDKRNYKWYSKMFENKRLDLILYEIKQILGEEK